MIVPHNSSATYPWDSRWQSLVETSTNSHEDHEGKIFCLTLDDLTLRLVIGNLAKWYQQLSATRVHFACEFMVQWRLMHTLQTPPLIKQCYTKMRTPTLGSPGKDRQGLTPLLLADGRPQVVELLTSAKDGRHPRDVMQWPHTSWNQQVRVWVLLWGIYEYIMVYLYNGIYCNTFSPSWQRS